MLSFEVVAWILNVDGGGLAGLILWLHKLILSDTPVQRDFWKFLNFLWWYAAVDITVYGQLTLCPGHVEQATVLDLAHQLSLGALDAS